MSLVCKKWTKCFMYKDFWRLYIKQLFNEQESLRYLGDGEFETISDPRGRSTIYNYFPPDVWGPNIQAKSLRAVKDTILSKRLRRLAQNGFCTIIKLKDEYMPSIHDPNELIAVESEKMHRMIEFTRVTKKTPPKRYMGLLYDENFNVVYYGRMDELGLKIPVKPRERNRLGFLKS